ncbi:MAG: nitronate monooxygenase [Ilumatobacteraceae bacterium]
MASRFTELVGCRLPLQQAAMSGIATPALAAAVSEAGGLGMLAAGRRSVDVARSQIEAVKRATDRPVGMGFIIEFLDRDVLEVAVDLLPVIEFFWGAPDARLVPGGRVVGWQIGDVDGARAAVDAGCSFVVAQGIEAGGHVCGEIELDRLVVDVRDAVGDVAVVAAGGIGTAADVRRLLDLGADAVRIGSRFVATHESDAHDRYVELLVAAGHADTELSEAFWVGWPDALHRVLTSAVEASGDGPDVIGHMPHPDGSMRVVPRFFVSPPLRSFTGSIDAMALYAGTGIDAITARTAAADVVAELTDQERP